MRRSGSRSVCKWRSPRKARSPEAISFFPLNFFLQVYCIIFFSFLNRLGLFFYSCSFCSCCCFFFSSKFWMSMFIVSFLFLFFSYAYIHRKFIIFVILKLTLLIFHLSLSSALAIYIYIDLTTHAYIYHIYRSSFKCSYFETFQFWNLTKLENVLMKKWQIDRIWIWYVLNSALTFLISKRWSLIC